jgi:hypothetical protein
MNHPCGKSVKKADRRKAGETSVVGQIKDAHPARGLGIVQNGVDGAKGELVNRLKKYQKGGRLPTCLRLILHDPFTREAPEFWMRLIIAVPIVCGSRRI